ncbi:MAG: CarD family transcriptional regulator [Anaerolineae bacterium]|nr:CarD family transcriptional regulator [Anaerolineae bacterium]
MAEQTHQYDAGSWIVHRYHGVGEIECIEEKKLGGDSRAYYKVVTDDSTLWVPLAEADESLFRPLASHEELEQVVQILQRPPREMATNHLSRRSRINNVRSENSLIEVARLLRDLWGRRAERQLNNTEERALRRLTNRLVSEWSVARDVDKATAEDQMRELLDKGLRDEAEFA